MSECHNILDMLGLFIEVGESNKVKPSKKVRGMSCTWLDKKRRLNRWTSDCIAGNNWGNHVLINWGNYVLIIIIYNFYLDTC